MKATINRSDLMKRAHSIFKNNRNLFPTFGLALSRAWEVEKANLQSAIRQEKEAESAKEFARRREASKQFRSSGQRARTMDAATVESYYANGAYSGD